jgi:hypothetical protein
MPPLAFGKNCRRPRTARMPARRSCIHTHEHARWPRLEHGWSMEPGGIPCAQCAMTDCNEADEPAECLRHRRRQGRCFRQPRIRPAFAAIGGHICTAESLFQAYFLYNDIGAYFNALACMSVRVKGRSAKVACRADNDDWAYTSQTLQIPCRVWMLP